MCSSLLVLTHTITALPSHRAGGTLPLEFASQLTRATYTIKNTIPLRLLMSRLLGGGGFLTDETNFYVDFADDAARNKYYLYTSTGERLFQFNWVSMGEDYSFDPATLEPFRNAERVIVSGHLAIALASDF